MYVNAMASRSFNDISAYPVMPWLIADYKCSTLELDNPEFFRDLSKPIGAINKHRLQKLRVNISIRTGEKREGGRDLTNKQA